MVRRYVREHQLLAISVLHILRSDLENLDMSERRKDFIGIAVEALDMGYEIHPEYFKVAPKFDLMKFACRVLKMRKVTARCFNRLGNLALERREYLLAVHYYTIAIEYNNRNPAYYCNRAEAFHNSNYIKKALDDCEYAVTLDPNCGRAFNRMGLVHICLQNQRIIRHCFQNAMRCEPKNKIFLYHYLLAKNSLLVINSPNNYDGTNPFPRFISPMRRVLHTIMFHSNSSGDGPTRAAVVPRNDDDDVDLDPLGPIAVAQPEYDPFNSIM